VLLKQFVYTCKSRFNLQTYLVCLINFPGHLPQSANHKHFCKVSSFSGVNVCAVGNKNKFSLFTIHSLWRVANGLRASITACRAFWTTRLLSSECLNGGKPEDAPCVELRGVATIERGKGGTMPRTPNHWRAPKSPNNVASTFFITVHYSQNSLVSNMGTPNFFLAPGAIQPRYAPGGVFHPTLTPRQGR